MTPDAVCAIVITFRPDAKAVAQLKKTRAQVQGLLVVDNGSTAETLAQLRTASCQIDLQLIENGRNIGIAAALNLGVRRALEQGFRWIILLDQDSAMTEQFVSQMLLDFERERTKRKLLQLVPQYQDPETNFETVFPMAQDGGPLVTITSGSLFPAAAFEECGYFEEKLFIYTVDDEYSLRIRSKGYSIAQSKTAVLLHSPGFPSRHRFLGAHFYTTNHSPGARYYLNRNRVWMLRVYGWRYPKWAKEIVRASIVDFIKITLAEKSRWVKTRMIALGIRDGLIGRMGKTISL